MKRGSNSRPVYSTEQGRLCPVCGAARADCRCRAAAPGIAGDGSVRLRRERKGRGGKAVTVIEGLPLPEPELKVLARELKQRCGVGGAVKAGRVEIQGDQREALAAALRERGYRVVLAGG
jgi:translation initiation factor 1